MIYLDNAATTCIYKEALNAMLPFYIDNYSNPSGTYDFSTAGRRAMNNARRKIADVIGADVTEIYFTSGGTEADNWALTGTANASSKKHIITSEIEHHAIIHTCKHLEKEGYDITFVPVDENGLIDPDDIEKAIRPETCLISIMMANNEIGTIQPIQQIGEIAKKNSITFHTDAVQTFGHISINVNEMHIDMLSASAHKCHGPKGIGFLYIRNGIKISSFYFGGKQERYMRAGTENVPAIVGFGEAAEKVQYSMKDNAYHIKKLRNHLINRVMNEIDYVRLNGDYNKRLPGNVNFSFKYIDGEAILIQLDFKGICCSTGSACNAGSKNVSHVLSAISIPEDYAHGSVRFTISEFNTINDIDYTVDALKEIVIKLREMSSEYKLKSKHFTNLEK